MRYTFLAAAALVLQAAPIAAQLPDYRHADSLALAIPASATGSVDTLAAYLNRGLTSDTERARAIYTWLTANVDYDVAAYFRGRLGIPSQLPADVLRRRRAVCDGFSGLFYALGTRMGLEVAVVQGVAKGGNGDPRSEQQRGGHSWNAVKVDGEWRLVDATWGAGDLIGRSFVRRVREFYFFADPERLVFSHLPRESRWQLLPRPLSGSEFNRQVALTRDFWDLGWEPEAVRGAGPELVGTFPVQGHTLRVRQAPVQGRLSPGTRVRLSLEAPGATEVVAVSGGVWHPLAAAEGVFTGDAAMGSDKMVLMVRYPDQDPKVVLEWQPAR